MTPDQKHLFDQWLHEVFSHAEHIAFTGDSSGIIAVVTTHEAPPDVLARCFDA